MDMLHGRRWIRTIAFAMLASAMLAVVAEAGHRRWARRCGFRHNHCCQTCCAPQFPVNNACCTTFADPHGGYASAPFIQQQPIAEIAPTQRQQPPAQEYADVPPPSDTEGRIAGAPNSPEVHRAFRPDLEQSGRVQDLEQQVDDLQSEVSELNRRVRQMEQDRGARQGSPAEIPRLPQDTENPARTDTQPAPEQPGASSNNQ